MGRRSSRHYWSSGATDNWRMHTGKLERTAGDPGACGWNHPRCPQTRGLDRGPNRSPRLDISDRCRLYFHFLEETPPSDVRG